MIRYIKQYLAIRSYAQRLSQDLVRRFGKRPFYTLDQVTQAIQRGKFSTAFSAYAHAAFCRQEDFDEYYGPLNVSCTYLGLRRTIARRYLSGVTDFDAETLFHRFRRINYQGYGYDESGSDSDATADGGHGH